MPVKGYLPEKHLETQHPGFLLEAGHTGSLCLVHTYRRLPAGRQVFGHTVHTVRAQEPLLTICGQFYISVGKCSPFKFPDEGEGPALQTDLSKQSNLRAAMLSLS